MAALGSNDSLLEVDLAENLIGKQETQKVINQIQQHDAVFSKMGVVLRFASFPHYPFDPFTSSVVVRAEVVQNALGKGNRRHGMDGAILFA